MKSKFTILMAMAFTILIASCSKDKFNENDAINAQKDLLNLKYQHELDLETLKQKGATAMQQLMNTAALEQLKLNDSLKVKNAANARKQDYSLSVVDVSSNTPLADADVTVSSEGKILTAKTNAQGVVTFTSLYLYPTSTFLISKTGYAATQISQQNILNYGSVKLWNTSDLSNEITGNLYIDTDLTNLTPEKAGANVLVTASVNIPTNSNEYYTVYYPTYTNAAGAYSIKVPTAPNSYYLRFEQIAADQKLYVNATEDDAVTSFPSSLPRLTTVKTYFNVNSFNAGVPSVNNSYYFKAAPDKGGKILYIQGYGNYSYNQVFVSSIGNKFQVEQLNINNPNNSNGYNELNMYTYDANAKINIELVDVTGNVIQSAPKLSGVAGTDGKLTYTYSPEGGYGYVHLRRDNAGALVPGAKGVILKASPYDSNFSLMSYSNNLNSATNRSVSNNYLLNNKGDKKVVNFYYGSGDSRVKQVY